MLQILYSCQISSFRFTSANIMKYCYGDENILDNGMPRRCDFGVRCLKYIGFIEGLNIVENFFEKK